MHIACAIVSSPISRRHHHQLPPLSRMSPQQPLRSPQVAEEGASATGVATAAVSPTTSFPALSKWDDHPAYKALMVRIRRAEKFGSAVTTADRTLYRQFKFDTYKDATSPATKGGTRASAGSPSARATAASAIAAVSPSSKKAGKQSSKKSKIDNISDEIKLEMLKRAKKFCIQNEETKLLEQWHAEKYGS